MSKNLKTVSLVTENCEIFTFDAKYISCIMYTKMCGDFYHMDKHSENLSEGLSIEFTANTELLVEETQAFSYQWNNRTDITAVELTFDDYSVKVIGLEWPLGEDNRYITDHPTQSWKITPTGNHMFNHSQTEE